MTDNKDIDVHVFAMRNVVTIILGFAGGVVGTLAVFAFKYPPEYVKEHALLSAPFLTFVALVILLALFHRPLYQLLSRGSLTLKWGDKEISIQEIEEKFDQEIESKLEVLASEIEDLRLQTKTAMEPNAKGGRKSQTVEASDSASVLDNIRKTFQIDSNDIGSIIYHLGTSKYKWRNLQTLAKRTGFSVSEVEELARKAPNVIVRGNSKAGNVIFRLTDAAKSQFGSIMAKSS